jgi:parvulin-like peptidyl-prolyl isomerase
MRHLRLIPALGAFFVLAVALAGCGSGVPGNSVADVAGNPITLDAWNHYMLVAAKYQALQNPGAPLIIASDPPNFPACVASIRHQIPSLKSSTTKQLRSDCKQLFTSYDGQVMNYLISAYWYQLEAQREHVPVRDSAVQKAFRASLKGQSPGQFEAFLKETGFTREDVLYRFRIQIAFTNMLAKRKTAVSQSDIQSYYSKNRAQFGTPEKRDIRIVLANSQAQALAAKSALSHGKSWDAVAKQYSQDAGTKTRGGLLTNVTQGTEDTALDTAAFAAPVNKLEGPVKGQYGYYIFEVTQIKPGTEQSLAQASPLIRQTLTNQLQQNAQSAVENAAKKNWMPKTQCRAVYAMADCKGYKQPKTSTTPSPASG